MISDEELLLFNQRGLIPGPDEKEEDFLIRAKEMIAFSENPPFAKDCIIESKDWSLAKDRTNALFDFFPDWVVGYYSNKSLPFWQGACAWISETDAPLIQLRNAFRKGSFLKFYKREEILAHELVHASRMSFNEPKFEEMLAFATSKSPIRKWWGSLFIRSWEPAVFISFLILSFLGQLFVRQESFWAQSIALFPWAISFYFVIRLIFLQAIFQRALKRLGIFVKEPAKSLAVLHRLTDKEIAMFAALSSKKCRAYIEKVKGSSLRWRLLNLAYF